MPDRRLQLLYEQQSLLLGTCRIESIRRDCQGCAMAWLRFRALLDMSTL